MKQFPGSGNRQRRRAMMIKMTEKTPEAREAKRCLPEGSNYCTAYSSCLPHSAIALPQPIEESYISFRLWSPSMNFRPDQFGLCLVYIPREFSVTADVIPALHLTDVLQGTYPNHFLSLQNDHLCGQSLPSPYTVLMPNNVGGSLLIKNAY